MSEVENRGKLSNPCVCFVSLGCLKALEFHHRIVSAINFMLEHAYEKGWAYPRFARSKGIESSQRQNH